MALLVKPRTGLWTDYGESGRTSGTFAPSSDTDGDEPDLQILQHDSWSQAQWFKVLIATSLTLATPYVTRLILSTLWGLRFFFFPTKTPSHQHHEEARLATPEIMGTPRGGREALKNFIVGAFGKESAWETRHRAFWFFALSIIFFVFYAQIVVGLLLTDVVVTSSSALLDSDRCGLFEYDNQRAGEEEAVRADMLMVKRERRAAAYAQDCYNADAGRSNNDMRCTFFHNSTIGYTVSDDKCPFYEAEVCAEGYQSGSAITLDTGLLDSSILGVNHKSTYRFRRTTTCAPLNSYRPYVQHFSNRGTNETGYKYFYGSLHDTRKCVDDVHPPPPMLTDYTLRISGHPFTWQAPVYKVE